MSDRERREAQQLQNLHAYVVVTAVWWAATLAPPIYLNANFAMSTGPFRDYAFIPAILSCGVPVLFGLPAGLALWAYARRLMNDFDNPGIFAVQRRVQQLLLVGVVLTVLMPLVAFGLR